MELNVTGSTSLEVSDQIFACEYNEALIHQVVTAHMAAARSGNQAQKTRAEVRGGGIKPFRQKGTGRARAGTIRSPLWRKGGVVFAAKPRSYAQKVNRKMYRGALRSIFSELLRQDRLQVLPSFDVTTQKTRDLLAQIRKLVPAENERILLVTEAVSENLYLAARNTHLVNVADTAAVDPVSLVGADRVLITAPALKLIEGALS